MLRPGGHVFAAGISRMVAATEVTVLAGFEVPADALATLLRTGEKSPEIEGPAGGFPGGHFHTAAELADELATAGFGDVEVVGVEGPGSFGLELLAPDDEVAAAAVVLAEHAQRHPLTADLSGHLLAVARRR